MKKKKILKLLAIIVLILFVICIIYFIRNFIIINKLARTYEKFFSSNNYSYSAVIGNNNLETFEYYYKEGKKLEIWKDENDVVNAMTWYDENTQEKIFIYPDKLTAEITVFQDNAINPANCVSSLLSNNIMDKIKRALTFFISTEKIDGEKYYVLQPLEGIISNTYYFSKENGTASKCFIGQTRIEFKEWNLNKTTDDDVNKPDLTGYKVTNNK